MQVRSCLCSMLFRIDNIDYLAKHMGLLAGFACILSEKGTAAIQATSHHVIVLRYLASVLQFI